MVGVSESVLHSVSKGVLGVLHSVSESAMHGVSKGVLHSVSVSVLDSESW
jgi:hypothetical protein